MDRRKRSSLIIDAVGIPDLFPVFLRMASPAGRIGLLGFSKARRSLYSWKW